MNNYQEKMEKLYYYAEAWETSIGEVMLELLTMQNFLSLFRYKRFKKTCILFYPNFFGQFPTERLIDFAVIV